ncbi:LOB domain-containing protein 12 [Linum perenne]
MGGSGTSPCASCKLLRRRCTKDCIFAPYFPSDDPHKFAIVHKVFGASNVSKMLQEIPVQQRGDAVSSLVYEANARVRDPVYGCVGAISFLQNQVSQLQMQLAVAQAEILCIQMQQQQEQGPEPEAAAAVLAAAFPTPHDHDHRLLLDDQQLQVVDHHHHDMMNSKSLMASTVATSNFASLHHHHQYLNFSSSANATNNAIQDPLKRESLWT